MEKPSLDTAKAGAMRFNTDSSQMEIYDGNQWTGILATSPELQTGGTRGLIMGGIKLNPTARTADESGDQEGVTTEQDAIAGCTGNTD